MTNREDLSRIGHVDRACGPIPAMLFSVGCGLVVYGTLGWIAYKFWEQALRWIVEYTR